MVIGAVGIVLAACVLVSAPAAAQEKTGAKTGFMLKPGAARVVLMRPTIRVASQSTGGMSEPNADWTAQAVENIDKALRDAQAQLGNDVVSYDEGVSGEGALTAQYGNLFSAVADSVITYQFFAAIACPPRNDRRNSSGAWGRASQGCIRWMAPIMRSS